LPESQFELRQNRMTKCFRGNTGPVRNKENRPVGRGQKVCGQVWHGNLEKMVMKKC
jgi:hypothetical protein